MFKITLAFCLSFIMAITSAVPIVYFSSTTALSSSITNDDDALTQMLETHSAFIDHFGLEFTINYFRSMDTLQQINAAIPQTEGGRNLYPDYFGGVYIDDNGVLVLLIVMPAEAVANGTSVSAFVDEAFNGALRNDSGAIIREVSFSYNELWEAMEFLNDFIFNNHDNPAATNADGWSLDVIGNRIIVHLETYSAANVELFRQLIIDSPVITFDQSIGPPMLLSGLPNYAEQEYEYDSAYAEYTDMYDLDIVSEWALEGITRAHALGLIPSGLFAFPTFTDYTLQTTRAEFTALAVALYETMTGEEIMGRIHFNDTDDVNIQKILSFPIIYKHS